MIYITIFVISLLFFLIQLDLSKFFVFSDANLYLYYADQISKGAILYKDLYMTNFPLVPYISVFYKYITFGSIDGFYMTACIEALMSAGVLFWSLKKIYKDNFVSTTGAIFYLSSFLVFSSANHQNGVLLAVLFFNKAYLCFLYKKYFLTGIFLGLSLMAKAYMAPVVLAFLIYLLIKKRNALLNTLYGIAQGISYLSGIPMLKGASDTNRKLFLSGILNKDTITSKIKRTKTVMIVYSSGDNFEIGKSSAIVNWSDLRSYCKVIHRQDFKMGYPVNKINIVRCF